MRIGLRVADPFGALLAFGVTALLATQAAGQPGRGWACLPTKGLPLPFVSFGGSALLVAMAADGRAPQRLAAGRGDAHDRDRVFKRYQQVHFVGIGGVGM